jgi:hypothetical protein
MMTFLGSKLNLSGSNSVSESADLVIRCKLNFSIFEIGARPLLMQKLIDIFEFFLTLNDVHESSHARLGIIASKYLTDKSALMESSQSDELPAVSH